MRSRECFTFNWYQELVSSNYHASHSLTFRYDTSEAGLRLFQFSEFAGPTIKQRHHKNEKKRLIENSDPWLTICLVNTTTEKLILQYLGTFMAFEAMNS